MATLDALKKIEAHLAAEGMSVEQIRIFASKWAPIQAAVDLRDDGIELAGVRELVTVVRNLESRG